MEGKKIPGMLSRSAGKGKSDYADSRLLQSTPKANIIIGSVNDYPQEYELRGKH